MPRPDRRSSIQDIARARLSDGFVGRVGEREDFRANLRFPGDDRRRRYLFSVHGLAGVGKTFLLEQLRGIAEESRAAVGFANDDQQDLPATLVKLANDLARCGHQLRRFEKRYEFYSKARERLHSDPQAPAAGRALVTKTVVKVGLGLAKSVPGGDLAAEAIDADAAAKQLEQLQGYLAAKFKRQADIQLLLDPAEELTKPFVEDLWRIPESSQIALFFDTFERTAPVLETWLLNLFGGLYGDLPQNLVLTTAGQFPLDEAKWNRHTPLIHEIELRPFTEQEARHLLAEHGITDEQVIEVVLRLTDGLPVLVAMLAKGNPAEAGKVGDPSGDAVDRFLRWVPEEAKRTIAATAALPRVLDEDVVGVLTGPEQASEVFRWLRALPFVGRRELPVRYHSVVRGPMVRLERDRSPGTFAEHHRRLSEHYEARCAELGLSGRVAWSDKRWQQRKLEQAYHRLCGAPAEALPGALLGAAEMIITGTASARSWARMMEQAGTDADAPAVLRWAQRLLEAIGADDVPREVEVLDLLAGAGEFDAAALSTVVCRRAEAYEERDELEAAERDYDRAIDLDPAAPQGWSYRGNLFHNKGEWEQALADLNRAIELDSSDAYSLRGRGSARAALGDLEGGLKDLDEAIRLEPGHAWAYTARCEVYRKRGDLRKAIDELDIAIRLDPDYAWAVHQRATLWHQLGENEEALAGYQAAVALRPKSVYYLTELAMFAERMGDADAAEQGFDAAVAAGPGEAWPLAARAAFHLRGERYRLAVDGFTSAIKIDPDYEWAVFMRGRAHADAGDLGAAFADFNRSIELEPLDPVNHTQRVITLLSQQEYQSALEALDRASELEPESAIIHARKGEALAGLERHDEARAKLDEAVQLDSDQPQVRYKRASHRFLFDEVEGALADIDHALAHGFDEELGLRLRADIRLSAGEYDLAIEDWRRVMALEKKHYGRAGLAETMLYSGRYQEALELMDEGLRGSDWGRYLAGLVELKSGRPDRARDEFTKAMDLAAAEVSEDPEYWVARFNRVVYLAVLGQDAEARSTLTEVLARSAPLESRVDFLRDLAALRRQVPELAPLTDELMSVVPGRE